MPRPEKGSQEAKDRMAKVRAARKQEGYVPPVNKRLTKKQKEMAALKDATVDIPIMGETTLVVPEYFAVPRKGGYKLVNPMSQERNLSSRRGQKSLKVVRKPVGDMVLVREDGAEEPLPLLAFTKKDRALIQNTFKLVEKYADRDPLDVPRIQRAKPLERGRPEKLPANVAVHKERKTKPGWSKKTKKPKSSEDQEEEKGDENISMTIEEPATTGYQRKKRETYDSEEARLEAIKVQKREYARRKRAAQKAAKGEGILDFLDPKKNGVAKAFDPNRNGVAKAFDPNRNGVAKAFKKTGEYLTAVVKGRGNEYPPKVRDLLKRWGDKTVVSAELRRAPVQSLITKAMNVATFGQWSKNMEKQPYDTLFHLQIVLTLEHPSGAVRLLLEKNEVINMDLLKTTALKKGTEVLPVAPISKAVLNDVLEKTKNKMGAKRFFDYNAENNNCQDFIAALLSANRWGDSNDFEFVKQETKELFKGLSGFSKFAYTATELGERANVAMTGRGMEGEGIRDMLKKLFGIKSNRIAVQDLSETERALREQLAEVQERLRMASTRVGELTSSDPLDTRIRAAEMMRAYTPEMITQFQTIDQQKRVAQAKKKQQEMLDAAKAALMGDFGDSSSSEREGTWAQIPEDIQGENSDGSYSAEYDPEMYGFGMKGGRLFLKDIPDLTRINEAYATIEMTETLIARLRGVLESGIHQGNQLTPVRRQQFQEALNTAIARRERLLAAIAEEMNRLARVGMGLKSFKSGASGSDFVIQSVIFKKDKYTVAEAKKWLKDNKYKSPKVDESDTVIRFRQISPKTVDRKGYTDYRTKELGNSGIALIIAYRRKMEDRLNGDFKGRLKQRLSDY